MIRYMEIFLVFTSVVENTSGYLENPSAGRWLQREFESLDNNSDGSITLPEFQALFSDVPGLRAFAFRKEQEQHCGPHLRRACNLVNPSINDLAKFSRHSRHFDFAVFGHLCRACNQQVSTADKSRTVVRKDIRKTGINSMLRGLKESKSAQLGYSENKGSDRKRFLSGADYLKALEESTFGSRPADAQTVT